MSDTTVPADRRSLLRRLRVPLITFALPLTLFVTLILFKQFSLGEFEWGADTEMPLYMGFTFATEIAIVVVAVWFVFFSGYRLATKFVGVVLAGLLVYAIYQVPRRWEFAGQMTPIPIFRWEPDLQAELEDRLHQQTTAQENRSALSTADLAVGPDDFPRYRGSAADGVAPPVAIHDDWSAHPPKRIWRTSVGWSYSGIAVAGKVAVTLEQRKAEEAVVCYNRADGKELWAYLQPTEFQQIPLMGGGGPRSTPTIADGDVYSLGAKGHLACLDGTNGKPRWSVNVVADNGAKVVDWGMTSSPLVVGNLVVVNAGIDPNKNQKQAVAAYDRKTGKKVWAAGEYAAGYSSPMLANLDGVEQIILFDAGGVAGIAIADGKELWRYPWTTFSNMNIIQPLVLPGNRVFISSEPTNGAALLHINKADSGWTVAPVWTSKAMGARFANPVYHAGHIYGLSNGFLVCLDAQTGKRLWKGERFDSGQLLVTSDTLLVQTERTGELVAVAADPADYRELGRIQVLQGTRTWNTFALAGTRLYMRNHEEMACLELAK
jgi:outer membrane protein assembly factor BamB